MSSPLPPELAAVERLLEASRSPLPAALRERVLAAAAKASPAPVPVATASGWFFAAVAIAAAVLLNLSNSAAVLAAGPLPEQPERSLGGNPWNWR